MRKCRMIIATGNDNKVREFREIIQNPEVTVLSMKQAGVSASPEETGKTFEENAVIKAEAVAALLSSLPDSNSRSLEPTIVISDDSGLEIDALGGAPGIYSARYMGHDTSYTLKMQHILEEMKDVPDEKRTARFVAAVAAVLPKELTGTGKTKTITVRGTMEGRIAHSILGSNGFGYDPFFYLPSLGMTSAQIPPEEKNALSHRGKALRAMMKELEQYLG